METLRAENVRNIQWKYFQLHRDENPALLIFISMDFYMKGSCKMKPFDIHGTKGLIIMEP